MNLRLKLAILQRFGSQAEFAGALGADDSKVSRVVRGRRDLPSEEKERWAKALCCKADSIFLSDPEKYCEA